MIEYYSYNNVLRFSTATSQKFEKNTYTFSRFPNLILICNVIWQQNNKVFSDSIWCLYLFIKLNLYISPFIVSREKYVSL